MFSIPDSTLSSIGRQLYINMEHGQHFEELMFKTKFVKWLLCVITTFVSEKASILHSVW